MQQTEPPAPRRLISTILHVVVRIEELLLAIMLTVMILLACYQIGLRWFTSGGLAWIDPLLRYMVLWSGLLGAVLATARDGHISLDVTSYLLSDRLKGWLTILTQGFSACVAFFLFRATLLFIRSEIEYGGTTLFNLPSWGWNIIFPIAFGLICFHFSVATLQAVSLVFSKPTEVTPQ
jgi:TRAP-type C4-dicarboxylate transport system permease small subunit